MCFKSVKDLLSIGSDMTGALPNRVFTMEKGGKYHFPCVHFCLLYVDEVVAILGRVEKYHTKGWDYI